MKIRIIAVLLLLALLLTSCNRNKGNDDSHGGRSDRTAKTQPIYRVVFGCFYFIDAVLYRCRSPPV